MNIPQKIHFRLTNLNIKPQMACVLSVESQNVYCRCDLGPGDACTHKDIVKTGLTQTFWGR